MKLIKNEILLLQKMKKNNYAEVASSIICDLINIKKPKKALTKNNFPNIRIFLYSYMTAHRHGMYRGGMEWVSVIDWKKGKASLEKFCTVHNI